MIYHLFLSRLIYNFFIFFKTDYDKTIRTTKIAQNVDFDK